MRAPVLRVVLRDSARRLEALPLAQGDLRAAGSIERIEASTDGEFSVEAELADEQTE